MTKQFDCVEKKRQAQEIIREKLTGMTAEEKLKFRQERGVSLK